MRSGSGGISLFLIGLDATVVALCRYLTPIFDKVSSLCDDERGNFALYFGIR
jgi:hypothetical protein